MKGFVLLSLVFAAVAMPQAKAEEVGKYVYAYDADTYRVLTLRYGPQDGNQMLVKISGIDNDQDGRIYQGEWKDAQPHGQGKLYYANTNLWYDGEWKEGKREGLGTSYYEDGNPAFAGEWKDGKQLK